MANVFILITMLLPDVYESSFISSFIERTSYNPLMDDKDSIASSPLQLQSHCCYSIYTRRGIIMEHTLSNENIEELLVLLQTRFHRFKERHVDIAWLDVLNHLEKNPSSLYSLSEMERTGGKPDVVGYDEIDEVYIFFDCSKESPLGRRNLCYDEKALLERKMNKPLDSATNMAKEMGISLLTETEYHMLQRLGSFDTKTSSWIHTPDTIRQLGGALFGDRRYDHVFVYHNGASSYYRVRGFRGSLKV